MLVRAHLRDLRPIPGGHGGVVPPDPISNSEVKRICADGSVAFAHARVGHCQGPSSSAPSGQTGGAPFFGRNLRLGQME